MVIPLIVIANGVAYLPDKLWKSGFTALIVLIYIVPDFRLVSVGIPTFSIDEFIQYHPAAERATLLGIRDLLVSIAEVFFITYLVLELQNALKESSRTRRLNRELTESRDKLAVANAQLQIYSERAEETAKVEERNRLAREIHDTVGHCLTGLSLGPAAAREVVEARGDQLGQIEEVREFVRMGVDAIFLTPVELRNIRPALEAARSAGIPVIDVDAAVFDLDLVDRLVATDNVLAGVLLAEDLDRRRPRTRIAVLDNLNAKSSIDRLDGFTGTLGSTSRWDPSSPRHRSSPRPRRGCRG